MISKDLLKEAFRKLLTYTYFDKTDMEADILLRMPTL